MMRRASVAMSRQLMCCSGSGQPVQFLKNELVSPSSFAFCVHQFDELLFRAANRLGQHDAGVVAGMDDDAADQVLDLDLRADLHEHLRAAHAARPFR